MSKHNNKKKTASFFDQQIQQYGPNWIYLMTTETVRKNAMKILKDISFGNIDPAEVAVYFSVADFTYNLMIAAIDNAKYNWWTFVGLTEVANRIEYDHTLTKVAHAHYEAWQAYEVAAAQLNNILIDINMTGGMYTQALLMQMISTLNPFRRQFSGYYITLPRAEDTRIHQRREILGGNQYDQGSNHQSQRNIWEEPDQGDM